MPVSANTEAQRGDDAGKPGSGISNEPLDVDIADVVPTFRPRKGPGKNGAALQNRGPKAERRSRLSLVGELKVPEGADPVKVADDHLSTLAPDAAKEVEYAIKFGSDQMRYIASRDLLAMKGITTKPKEVQQAPTAVHFHLGNLPKTQAGVPILPFSNAAKKLAPGVSNVPKASETTLDAEKSGVTVNAKKGAK